MKKKIMIPLIILAAVFTACNDGSADNAANRKDGYTHEAGNKTDSLWQEVMEGHDVGMAKTGKLNKYVAMVKNALDSVGKLPASAANDNVRQALLSLQTDLQQAQQGMKNWMNTFKHDSAEGNETLRIQYLESEKIKVNAVKDNILTSLQKADSLFKTMPSKQ